MGTGNPYLIISATENLFLSPADGIVVEIKIFLKILLSQRSKRYYVVLLT